MSVLLFIVGILVMVVAIAVSIGLHEVGHLLPAKLFKVRVPQYMIGFGKTIWSFRRGETEYGFKAIPLGGYISMIGMYPPAKAKKGEEATDADGAPVLRQSSTGMFQQMADEARHAAAEQLQPGDGNRVFYKLPVYKRVIIMLGGPLMNLLIGTVMIGILLVGFGVPEQTNKVSEVYQCVVPLSQQPTRDTAANGGCLPGDPQAPAYAAGLRPGDLITSFGGVAIGQTQWLELITLIRDAAGKPTPVTFVRDGVEKTATITPLATERPALDINGQP